MMKKNEFREKWHIPIVDVSHVLMTIKLSLRICLIKIMLIDNAQNWCDINL